MLLHYGRILSDENLVRGYVLYARRARCSTYWLYCTVINLYPNRFLSSYIAIENAKIDVKLKYNCLIITTFIDHTVNSWLNPVYNLRIGLGFNQFRHISLLRELVSPCPYIHIGRLTCRCNKCQSNVKDKFACIKTHRIAQNEQLQGGTMYDRVYT